MSAPDDTDEASAKPLMQEQKDTAGKSGSKVKIPPLDPQQPRKRHRSDPVDSPLANTRDAEKSLTTQRVRYSASELRAHLRAQSREPFKELLADFMEHSPEPASIKELATKYPEHWAKTVSLIARLAGYGDHSTVEHTHMIQIEQMSDSALGEHLHELIGEAAKLGAIDADFIELPSQAQPASEATVNDTDQLDYGKHDLTQSELDDEESDSHERLRLGR